MPKLKKKGKRIGMKRSVKKSLKGSVVGTDGGTPGQPASGAASTATTESPFAKPSVLKPKIATTPKSLSSDVTDSKTGVNIKHEDTDSRGSTSSSVGVPQATTPLSSVKKKKPVTITKTIVTIEGDVNSTPQPKLTSSTCGSSKEMGTPKLQLKVGDPLPPSVTASDIFEYQWPEGSGSYYVLQEQITEFLQIKSFKRKYPNFYRRSCEVEERQYLMDSNIFKENEPQYNLGLTALRVDDVIDLMQKEYPLKYCEYLAALDSKKHESLMSVTKGYTIPTVEKSKMAEFIKRSMKSASDFNLRLNQERNDERRIHYDFQTNSYHYPLGLGHRNRQLQKNLKTGRIKMRKGRYPVALIPGQYQDWFMRYTPQELSYFPLNTVLYGPVITDPSKIPPLLSTPEEASSISDSDDDMSDDDSDDDSIDSCCSSQDKDDNDDPMDGGSVDGSGSSSSSSGSSDSESDDERMETGGVGPPPAPLLMRELTKVKPDALCKMCHKSIQSESVHCSDCKESIHTSCLEISQEMVDVIRSYDWQCSDCKSCVTCKKSTGEAEMMFCDKCDRGYHTFCVGVNVLPEGKWVCSLCAQCATCGSTDPTNGISGMIMAGINDSWQHETIKIISPNGETLRRHQLLCQSCFKQRYRK